MVLVVLILGSASLLLWQGRSGTVKQMASDRVTQSKVLRCGYVLYEPFVIKDPNTGVLSGIIVDYLREVGARQGYKVEWVAETNIDQVIPALDGWKFDAMCTPCTPIPDFERVVGFAASLGGLPYYTYVAEKSGLTAETLPKARFALLDGFALSGITRNAYPEGAFYSLPQTASVSEFFDQLRYGKADAVVNEGIAAENYMRANPGVIRRFSDKPVIAMRMFLPVAKADTAMHAFMDRTFGVDQPENEAIMQKMMAKYHASEGALLLGAACLPVVSEKGQKICDLSKK